MRSQRLSLWSSLQRGDFVSITRLGVQCHRGAIDDLTEDHRTIWVTDHIGDRRLFHIDDDYDVLVSL
jgi:hypothetical protein